MTRFSWLPAAFLLAATFFLTPSSLYAGIVVLNGLTKLHDVVPGETYRGAIEIQNTGNTEQPVKLYQQDYSFNHTGEVFYEKPGSSRRSNATWIDLSPSFLVLKPKEKTTISYEVRVPNDTDGFTGTFWSVVMVEGEAPVDTNQLNRGLTIQTQLRYAIQIATTFGQSHGERNLTFYNIQLNQESAQRTLSVDIENKGDFLFKPEVTAEFFNASGQSVGVFSGLKKKIYPGTSAKFDLPLDAIQPGNYQVLVLADCGEEDVFGITVNLEVK